MHIVMINAESVFHKVGVGYESESNVISHWTRFPLPELTGDRFPLPELTGDRFPLPVNTSRVDGRAFPLAELTGRQLG